MRVHVSVHCKPDTAAAYRSVLDNHILPAQGAMALGEVGRAEVSELHHRLRETPIVANTVMGVLAKMFSLAEAWGLVPPGRNPCRAVRRYRTRTCERFLTLAEHPLLGGALKGEERGLRRLLVGDYRVIYEVQDDAPRRSGYPHHPLAQWRWTQTRRPEQRRLIVEHRR